MPEETALVDSVNARLARAALTASAEILVAEYLKPLIASLRPDSDMAAFAASIHVQLEREVTAAVDTALDNVFDQLLPPEEGAT